LNTEAQEKEKIGKKKKQTPNQKPHKKRRSKRGGGGVTETEKTVSKVKLDKTHRGQWEGFDDIVGLDRGGEDSMGNGGGGETVSIAKKRVGGQAKIRKKIAKTVKGGKEREKKRRKRKIWDGGKFNQKKNEKDRVPPAGGPERKKKQTSGAKEKQFIHWEGSKKNRLTRGEPAKSKGEIE